MSYNTQAYYQAEDYQPHEENEDYPYCTEADPYPEEPEYGYNNEDLQELYANKTQFVDQQTQQAQEDLNYQNQKICQSDCYACQDESYYEIKPPPNSLLPLHRSCVPRKVSTQSQYYQQRYHSDPKSPEYCPVPSESHCQTRNLETTTSFSSNRCRSANANLYPSLSRCNTHSQQQYAYYEGQQLHVDRASGSSKKRSVTAKTPKYYKPPHANSVRKKTSALSLAVNSQPDPALSKRHHRKHSSHCSHYQNQQNYQNVPQNNESYQRIDEQRVDSMPDEAIYDAEEICKPLATHIHSEGDVPHQTTEAGGLDDSLDNFEEEIKSQQELLKNNSELARIVKYLKPRVPASIRARTLKQQQDNVATAMASHIAEVQPTGTISITSVNGKTPERAVTMSLEKLLHQLQKCEPPSEEILNPQEAQSVVGRQQDKRNNDKSQGNDGKEATAYEDFPKDKSFNYDSISKKLSFTKVSESVEDISEAVKPNPSHTLVRKKSSRSSRTVSLDDNGAMELHRSKSYIVALIDKALSKELGTIPDGKTTRAEFQNMSAKKAINIVHRHSQHKSQPKELCYEITAALTDSIISAATAPEPDVKDEGMNFSKTRSTCSMGDAYIKQLKQLRWGHIKHIQHEVKKLEDLERFLECFSNDQL